MICTIYSTDEEQDLLTSYAKCHHLSLEVSFIQALFSQIIDEYDAEIADSAYNDYLNSNKSSTQIDEFLGWTTLIY